MPQPKTEKHALYVQLMPLETLDVDLDPSFKSVAFSGACVTRTGTNEFAAESETTCHALLLNLVATQVANPATCQLSQC
jgi:hypothetical protein